jgi:hypothetical protein
MRLIGGPIAWRSNALRFCRALEPYYDAARDRVRQDLLDYCHRNTLAMVRLVETLEGLARVALASPWLPSRLIPHRHRPRAELQPAYELQVDTLR